MTNIKLLIGIKKSLKDSLIDVNNLNDCINKRCWQEMIEDLIKDVSETIKIEKSKTNN
jgi:hypothetical protein